MNREAVLLNLRDIRDLEVAKICIIRKCNEDRYAYQRQINNLAAVHYAEIKEERKGTSSGIVFSLIGVLVGATILIASLSNMGSGEGWPPILNIIVAILRSPSLSILGIIAGVPILGFSAFALSGELNIQDANAKVKEENIQAKKHNAAENARLAANQPQIDKLQKDLQSREAYWSGELEQVEALLNDEYSINLIPLQYRNNFSAIQYIYEYMSSSSASLETTLLSVQLEAGIQRIEAKLDIIIMQQEELIFQMYRYEGQNQQIIAQNKSMLASLLRTETNTAEAAQYARLSASYGKTCSFFAAASYFQAPN